MRGWLKFFVVWCLALALPVQALASAAMTHCQGSHEGMHPVQMAQAGASEHHAHHASAEMGGDDTVASSEALSDQGPSTCSACAACCSMVALLAGIGALVSPEIVPTVFSPSVMAVEPFAAVGPERPPRIFFA